MQIMERCSHGIIRCTCAICNGMMAKKDSLKVYSSENRARRDELRARYIYMQESSKFFGINHKKPYTDDELKYIIKHTEGTTRQDTELFFNIARQVQRRLGSIEWLWNYMWRENFDEVLKEGFDNKLYGRIQELKKEMGV